MSSLIEGIVDKVDNVTKRFVICHGPTYVQQVRWIAILVNQASVAPVGEITCQELLQISRESLALACEARAFVDKILADPECKHWKKDYDGLDFWTDELEVACMKLDARIDEITTLTKPEVKEQEPGAGERERSESPVPPSRRGSVLPWREVLDWVRGAAENKGENDEKQ